MDFFHILAHCATYRELLTWPRNGDTPLNKRYVIIPTAQRSEAKEAPSPFTISGDTYSGCPYSNLTIPTILRANEKSVILISVPPGREKRISKGVKP